jgi:hypothetical protein
VAIRTQPDIAAAAEQFEQLLHVSMTELSAKRPVFYSEADFQHALAWQLHLLRPTAQLRLEVPLTEADLGARADRLDILVRLDGWRVALELKYPRDRFSWQGDDEPVPYRRNNRDAADDAAYATINDLHRTERWVSLGAADVGVVLALTNIKTFWRAVPATVALDAEFRFPDGTEIAGVRRWGQGGRLKPPIDLGGRYVSRWRDYSRLADGTGATQFRYVVLRPLG